MMEEYVDEWSDLMDRALASIRSGAQIQERGAQRLFQLVVIPAFEVAASWELIRIWSPTTSPSFDIALLTWDQQSDAAKFENPLARLKHGRRHDV